MNSELFIASRIIKGKNSAENKNISGTRPIVRIAIGGISLGMVVMIVAIAIVTGFKNEIRGKVIGFGSHIQITSFDSNSSTEQIPISKNQDFYPRLDTVTGINHIQVFATKAGIIRTDTDIEGIVVKGVGSDFDWTFFKKHLVEGEAFIVSDTARTKDVLISEQISRKLKLNVGDKLYVYFIQQQEQKARVFTISGIYKSGLEEYDKLYILADIGHIQHLNNWEEDQVSGFEVTIDNFDDLDGAADYIYSQIGYDLTCKTIREVRPQIFDWLDLQNINVQIIIILMLLVAGFNMISALLIMILERVSMIGILKALGMTNFSIQKVFLMNALYMTGVGMLIGNIVGIALCFIQWKFELITLNEESYYMSVVPINLNFWYVLLLNVGTLLACTLMLILPSFLITRISPLKAIRYS